MHTKTPAEQPKNSGNSKPPIGLRHRWREGAQKPGGLRALFVVSMISLLILSGLIFLALFEPPLPYTVSHGRSQALDSPEFVHMLSTLTGAPVRHYQGVHVFTNGPAYYSAELDAIRKAQKNIDIEAYIFQKGEIADKFRDALAERARAGVEVKMLIDAVGSASTTYDYFKPLTDAGGRVAFYKPLRWYTWPRMNNRTHRELIVIDGVTAFIGGSGIADHWLKQTGKDDPAWRDTMVRVDGEVVTGMQGSFAENWLESTGDIITDPAYFPIIPPVGPGDRGLVVASSPGAGRATEARLLFQLLIASASRSIRITTPYFLPDDSIQDELVRAVKEHHVDVSIIVPGHKSDHALTRNSSRRLYGPLLQAGAKIHEYQPSMIHTKSLIIDGLWSVVGSTNMDSRSFGLNDEINLVVADPALAARLEQDFDRDLGRSKNVTFEEWKKRSVFERMQESFGALLQRQQ